VPLHALNNSVGAIFGPAKGRSPGEELAQKARADLDPFKAWSLEDATEKHGDLSEFTMLAFGEDLLIELDADLQGLQDEYESNKVAIQAESTFWERKDEASQHKGGLYAVAAAPFKVLNAVALAPAKVLKRFFKTSIAHHRYSRDQRWLMLETNRNLYRVQALLAGKTEKQIVMEWVQANVLKNRRPHRTVSFDGIKKPWAEREERKTSHERKEKEFYDYVFSLMGDSQMANDAVKLSLMGDDNSWQKRRWKQYERFGATMFVIPSKTGRNHVRDS